MNNNSLPLPPPRKKTIVCALEYYNQIQLLHGFICLIRDKLEIIIANNNDIELLKTETCRSAVHRTSNVLLFYH